MKIYDLLEKSKDKKRDILAVLKRMIPAIHLPGGDCFQMLLQRMRCAGEDFWPHLPGQGLSRTCRMDVGREGELREVSQVRGRGARVPDASGWDDLRPDSVHSRHLRHLLRK